MVTKADRKQSLREFLKSPCVATPRCQTCKGDKEIVAAVESFVVAQDKGQTAQTFVAFHRFLVNEYGYEFKETALFAHIKSCVRGSK